MKYTSWSDSMLCSRTYGIWTVWPWKYGIGTVALETSSQTLVRQAMELRGSPALPGKTAQAPAVRARNVLTWGLSNSWKPITSASDAWTIEVAQDIRVGAGAQPFLLPPALVCDAPSTLNVPMRNVVGFRAATFCVLRRSSLPTFPTRCGLTVGAAWMRCPALTDCVGARVATATSAALGPGSSAPPPGRKIASTAIPSPSTPTTALAATAASVVPAGSERPTCLV